MESTRIKKHLDRLLLDPNNYRFIDKAEYKVVPDENVGDPKIQQRTFNFLLGNKNNNITDLINSFTTNGFLDIDQIQVRPIGDNYIVLEGNRRIATLKYLYAEFKKGNDVGLLEERDFKSVNVVEVTGTDPAQHLITMGLHHISGKKRWFAVNEGQLIQDLVTKYGKTEDDICQALGLSKIAIRRSQRTFALIQDYKDSDYGDQFKASMYSIFESVISNPVMRSWIQWNNSEHKAENTENINRFYSWISQTEEIDWDNDRQDKTVKEPIINQYREVKEIASFINDEAAVARMEESRSIVKGYTASSEIGKNKLHEATNNIKSFIQIAFNYRDLIDANLIVEFQKAKTSLEKLIPETKAQVFINDKVKSKYSDVINKHFTTFNINKYRKLENIEIKKLGRVNIFAGGNNMGKTSFLEAFFLSSQLNDIDSFMWLERYRGKLLTQFHSKWIEKTFINNIQIEGNFNSMPFSISYKKEETEEDIEKLGYLKTIISEAKVEDKTLSSYIHLFANKEPELHYNKSKVLCQSAFTSPYRYNESQLHTAHKLAIENKYYEEVIEFIKTNLDNNIKKIDLVNDEGENRFIVTSNNGVFDLTKYGEGLQQVFGIALLLGYCKNGVLCIDEVDSAIHTGLLIKFTEFIQKTAEKFNVQVFLSTHSKECIDAFVKNGFPDDELTAYTLTTDEDGSINCEFLRGNKLKRLVESIDIDIR